MRTLLAIALLVSVAHAQPPASDRKARANAAFIAGEAQYTHGNYVGAIEHFKIAYDLDPDPGYLFNIAQSYRFANNCVNAAKYYKQFLDAVPNPPNAEKIRRWYRDAETCAKATAPVEPPKVVTPGQGKPGIGFDRAPPAPGSEPAPSLVQPEPPLEDVPSGSSRRVLVVATLVSGVVGLAAGGYHTWKVSQLEADREALVQSCSRGDPCNASDLTDLDQRGTRTSLYAGIGYAVGGAGLVGGILLIVLARDSEVPIAVSPTATGATVSGRFRF
jgi:tetratricopeptide (TPR) repeat protein